MSRIACLLAPLFVAGCFFTPDVDAPESGVSESSSEATEESGGEVDCPGQTPAQECVCMSSDDFIEAWSWFETYLVTRTDDGSCGFEAAAGYCGKTSQGDDSCGGGPMPGLDCDPETYLDVWFRRNDDGSVELARGSTCSGFGDFEPCNGSVLNAEEDWGEVAIECLCACEANNPWAG